MRAWVVGACLLSVSVVAEGAPPAKTPPPEKEPQEQETLSRPERQWRWIREATDDTCREQLAQTKAKFHPLRDREKPDAKGCGIPRGVLLRTGPTGVRYSPPIQIDCSFALRLAEIETVIQEEVKQHFDSEVVKLGTLGSYACRGVIGWLRGWSGGISEHSFGNAVDITHFDLKNGRRISVLRHYPRDRGPAETNEAIFLRSVVRRVRRDLDLRALSPDFDVSHRDHLHFDAGSRWWRP
ncbi:MAG TPA: extensin family protein [Polyangiaceae bacterium]|jgi:hypothetical protein|nr:extensin family protein [Polyangiaceae bacterium]